MTPRLVRLLLCGLCLLFLGCPPKGLRMKLASPNEKLPDPSFVVIYDDKDLRGSVDVIRCDDMDHFGEIMWLAIANGGVPGEMRDPNVITFGGRHQVVDKFTYGVPPPDFFSKVAPKPLKPGGKYIISVGSGGQVSFVAGPDGRVTTWQ